MNPRYVAYAHAHGNDPETQMAVDAEAWPGGRMAGFILWMHAQLAEWRRRNNRVANSVLSHDDQVAIDRWLGGELTLGLAA